MKINFAKSLNGAVLLLTLLASNAFSANNFNPMVNMNNITPMNQSMNMMNHQQFNMNNITPMSYSQQLNMNNIITMNQSMNMMNYQQFNMNNITPMNQSMNMMNHQQLNMNNINLMNQNTYNNKKYNINQNNIICNNENCNKESNNIKDLKNKSSINSNLKINIPKSIEEKFKIAPPFENIHKSLTEYIYQDQDPNKSKFCTRFNDDMQNFFGSLCNNGYKILKNFLFENTCLDTSALNYIEAILGMNKVKERSIYMYFYDEEFMKEFVKIDKIFIDEYYENNVNDDGIGEFNNFKQIYIDYWDKNLKDDSNGIQKTADENNKNLKDYLNEIQKIACEIRTKFFNDIKKECIPQNRNIKICKTIYKKIEEYFKQDTLKEQIVSNKTSGAHISYIFNEICNKYKKEQLGENYIEPETTIILPKVKTEKDSEKQKEQK